MQIILSILFLALLIKDTSGFGGRYLLRGPTQVTALAGGSFWLLCHFGDTGLKKYTLLILYFIAIALSAIFSREVFYSGAQVVSLGALFLFFVSYHESLLERIERNRVFVDVVILSGTVVCVASLLAIVIWPDIAYLYIQWPGSRRFRGFFGQPASMAAISGAVNGLVLFTQKRWFVKLTVGLLSFICLALTGSRTFWFAWLGATLFVLWQVTRGERLKWIITSLYCIVFIAAHINAIGMLQVRKEVNKALRTESFSNLTGRASIWQRALEEFIKRPLLGHGFATGDEAFRQWSGSSEQQLRKLRIVRFTLHNGYVQALLDSGLIGAILYILLLLRALLNVIRLGATGYPEAVFVIIYMIIGNMGQSFMFNASRAHSLLGWYFVIFGLSLGKQNGFGKLHY